METVIVICLLLVFALLLQDKIAVGKGHQEKQKNEKTNPKLPDIMGQPKPLRSLSLPKRAAGSPDNNLKAQTNNFDIEIYQDFDLQIQQEGLDDVFRNAADLKEEQEEWNSYGISGVNYGFAQGVTLEELNSMEKLLQKDKLQPSEQETAIDFVQKIQGTELFSLLENSMESSSRKIAELLELRLSSEPLANASDQRENNSGDFDIGKFI